MKRPRNMEEFSAAAGLSRPTVSKYFADPESVRPATRARIERAMAELDWRPNFFALHQNRRSPRIVGIVVPLLTDPFFAELVRRLETCAHAAGYWPVVMSSHGEPGRERNAIDTLRSQNIAGAVLAPLGEASDLAQIERLAREVPVVLLDGRIAPGLAFVGTDNAGSVGAMVRHLCSTGSAPVFLAMPEVTGNARERRAAYLAAMAAAGAAPRVVEPLRGGWDFEAIGFETAARALDRGEVGEGATLLCANDRLAIGVMAAACARGLGIGPDRALRVAGHDDHPLSRYTCPGLTTSAQDFAGLAATSFALVRDAAEGGTAAPAVHLLPAALIRRGSA